MSLARSVVMAGLAAACGPALPAVRPPDPPPDPHACTIQTRRLSADAAGAERPEIATLGRTLGVVWQQPGARGEDLLLQSFDLDGRPLGERTTIAQLPEGGGAPRLAPDGDGWAALWAVDHEDTSVLAIRRFDQVGVARGEAAPAISAPGARSLAFSPVFCIADQDCAPGFAVVWWTAAGDQPRQVVTWLDGVGRPVGRPVELTRAPPADPLADLRADGNRVRATWESLVDGRAHVMAGLVARGGVSAQLDLGAGDAPGLGDLGVVFAHLDDASIWWSPFDRAAPARFTDGQFPDTTAVGPGHSVLCVMRNASTDEASIDELDCLDLVGGVPVRDQPVHTAPGGLRALEVVPTELGWAVAFQTAEPDGTAVHLATVRCPPPEVSGAPGAASRR